VAFVLRRSADGALLLAAGEALELGIERAIPVVDGPLRIRVPPRRSSLRPPSRWR